MDDRTSTEFKEVRTAPLESPPPADAPAHAEPCPAGAPHDVRPAAPSASPRRGSRWRKFFWFLVLLAIAGAVGWRLYDRPEPQRPAGRFAGGGPMPVLVAPAQAGDIDITLSALGTVTSLATVTVRTQISGQLVRVAYQEGQSVNKGDLLAEIDARPYEAALKQAQGQLARDQALLEGAKVDLARYRRLAAQNAVARQQLDTQEALVAQYEGTVAADQALVQTAQLNLDYCRILAPISGRVGLRPVDQGNYVTPGDASGIVVITQLKPISVMFTLPEDSLQSVLRRVNAGARLPVSAFDRGGANKIADGVLRTVDNQIDTATGTVKLRAEFANDEQTLYPNQFVNVRLLVDTLKDMIVVPTSAVLRGVPGTFVYLVNADETVSVRKVEVGPVDRGRTLIRSGLAAGDRVVVDGSDKLRDGAKIVLRGPADEITPAVPRARQPGAGERRRRRPGGEQ
ncbi:MAG: MdtA/MuxA family multidrug efflux RND transporter periplasmic adaptor subunit [Variibacter sp.]|nr:MdtA/MuxA family multidrug efflux RND transporter periplasmic adaptor subunit [Variibacter sp.]